TPTKSKSSEGYRSWPNFYSDGPDSNYFSTPPSQDPVGVSGAPTKPRRARGYKLRKPRRWLVVRLTRYSSVIRIGHLIARTGKDSIPTFTLLPVIVRVLTRLLHRCYRASCCKYLWTKAIAMLPSPTAEATRLTGLNLTSPQAKMPGTLDSRR